MSGQAYSGVTVAEATRRSGYAMRALRRLLESDGVPDPPVVVGDNVGRPAGPVRLPGALDGTPGYLTGKDSSVTVCHIGHTHDAG
jgi:hypothetical protein